MKATRDEPRSISKSPGNNVFNFHSQLVKPDPRVKRLVSGLSNADRLGDDPPPIVLLLNKASALLVGPILFHLTGYEYFECLMKPQRGMTT